MNDNQAEPLGFTAPPLPAPRSSELLRAPADGVTVRMYRQGLGDCFLLALPTSDPGQSYYVLIDCGVLQGAPNGAANLNTVARDIQAATGGQIHLLVATHRHADHISGFSLAKDVFTGMTIHNLWLGWAENPADPQYKALWERSNQALAALRRAVQAQPAAMAGVSGVLDFAGDQWIAGELGALGSDPMEPVRSLLKSGAMPEYRCPGEGPLALPAVAGRAAAEGVRLYVFGPPTSLAALGQMDPAGGTNETYLARGLPNEITAFLAAATDLQAALSDDERAARERSFPFQAGLRIPREEAREEEFFRRRYGFDESGAAHPVPGKAGARDGEAGEAWRRIDEDWLSSSEELALQLDNCINNTSLVLAMELVKTGRVLLFAADAQVGNWLSWAELPDFALPEGGTVGIRDLLKRTVFYKVGHHGSHNATGRALDDNTPWGLELMTSPDLVAMIPVDEAFANQVKHWPMPWPKLYERLGEVTKGRILRLDHGAPENAQPDAEWQAFMGQVEVTPLYVQYTVSEPRPHPS
ncbi:MAG: hypothetical protein ACM30E_12995 [Nitrososphaerales archaeon]